MDKKYVVEHGVPGSVRDCNTVEDLQRYLDSNPYPTYRLVSCQFVEGNFIMVWELIDGVQARD